MTGFGVELGFVVIGLVAFLVALRAYDAIARPR